MSAAVNELGACPLHSLQLSPTYSRALRQTLRAHRAANLHLGRPRKRQHRANRALRLGIPPTTSRAVGRLCGDEGDVQGVPCILLDAAGRQGGGRLPGGPLNLLLLHGPGRQVRGRVREGEHGRRRRRTRAEGDCGVEGADGKNDVTGVNLACSVLHDALRGLYIPSQSHDAGCVTLPTRWVKCAV